MGRKAKKPQDKRRNRVILLLTDAEERLLRGHARARGLIRFDRKRQSLGPAVRALLAFLKVI